MFCTCQEPKKMKNNAHGEVFYVCAKSKGGCGCEISENNNVNPHMDLKLTLDADDLLQNLETWSKNLGF